MFSVCRQVSRGYAAFRSFAQYSEAESRGFESRPVHYINQQVTAFFSRFDRQ